MEDVLYHKFKEDKMPKTIHGKPVDEHDWNKAKQLAKDEGRNN